MCGYFSFCLHIVEPYGNIFRFNAGVKIVNNIFMDNL